ncbi:hypothetical protein [Spirosoma sp. KNUC1025]|uniref:hypothetical protein n=1 Tax=Spirosoma sp. KNUC1025 TaxID=2894082 RepID=UPI003867FBB3|nr:hypothetical protein LN737_05150 [Spirosoma sp. KNUC1025]
MKRSEKVRLLANVLEKGASQNTRQRLLEARQPGCLVGILYPGQSEPGAEDVVSIHIDGKEVRMSHAEAEAYAQRFGHPVIFMIPDNGR